MSIPTPAPSATAPTPIQTNQSETTISIQDLESGKIEIDPLIKEIEELKAHISKLRYDMTVYVRLLSSIDESTHPVTIFADLQNQINTIKSNISHYYTAYKRLLPVIRYTKLKSGINPDDTIKVEPHKVKIEPVSNRLETRASTVNGNINGNISGSDANTPGLIPTHTMGGTPSAIQPPVQTPMQNQAQVTSSSAAKKTTAAAKKPRQKKADSKNNNGSPNDPISI